MDVGALSREYMIPLDEIDTAGSRVIASPERCLGNLQLLELVVAPQARREATRKMLVDAFMNGFFFYVRLARIAHIAHTSRTHRMHVHVRQSSVYTVRIHTLCSRSSS